MGDEQKDLQVRAIIAGTDDKPCVQIVFPLSKSSIAEGKVMINLSPDEARQAARDLTARSYEAEIYNLFEFLKEKVRVDDSLFELILQDYINWRKK